MLSHREAAKIWGIGRATIQRAIKSGKLSLKTDKTIDPAEMIRVFGEPSSHIESRPAIPPDSTSEPAQIHRDLIRLKEFEIENVKLKAVVEAQAAHIKSMDQAMLLLTHDKPNRRWWQFK